MHQHLQRLSLGASERIGTLDEQACADAFGSCETRVYPLIVDMSYCIHRLVQEHYGVRRI